MNVELKGIKPVHILAFFIGLVLVVLAIQERLEIADAVRAVKESSRDAPKP